MMNDKIKLKAIKLPDEINAICCVACRHISERPLMAAEGEAEGEDIIICPHCLAEGDIDAKLERHAARLESTVAMATRPHRAARGAVPGGAQGVRPSRRHRASSGFWMLSDLLDEASCCDQSGGSSSGEPAAGYRGAWPLIKSDAEVDPERGKALAAALAKRREFLGPGAEL